MRRDEFLLQTITLDQLGVAAACEHQSVVASQQKRHCHPAKRAITVDQGLLHQYNDGRRYQEMDGQAQGGFGDGDYSRKDFDLRGFPRL